MSEYTIDTGFTFGVNADQDVINKLESITGHATKYAEAMGNLKTYFNASNNLWTGEDATALRETATAKNGPLDKLEACSEELNNLSDLSKALLGAISTAQSQLKTNVQTAMKVGDE